MIFDIILMIFFILYLGALHVVLSVLKDTAVNQIRPLYDGTRSPEHAELRCRDSDDVFGMSEDKNFRYF